MDENIGVPIVSADAFDGVTSGTAGILDAIDFPVIVIGRDCKVTRVNRAATTVLGLTLPDIGRSPGNIFTGE